MRRFIVDTLDFLAIAAILIATFLGAARGAQFGGPLGLVAGAIAAFVVSALAGGMVLALTEIAKNTRRLIELGEKAERAS